MPQWGLPTTFSFPGWTSPAPSACIHRRGAPALCPSPTVPHHSSTEGSRSGCSTPDGTSQGQNRGTITSLSLLATQVLPRSRSLTAHTYRRNVLKMSLENHLLVFVLSVVRSLKKPQRNSIKPHWCRVSKWEGRGWRQVKCPQQP